MKFSPTLIITFLLALGMCQGKTHINTKNSPDDSYLFPTDASRQINSGFADFRSSHFHGGMDISTNGKIGYPVFAAKSGYVYRLEVSPFGYGKMVVLRHDDSTYTLYGHLSGFSKELQQKVEAVQAETGKYDVDFRFQPGEIKVDRGEIIAYTGASGVGGPHLHFEIRDKNNSFIDPLIYSSLDVPSYRTPKIFNVAVRGFNSGEAQVSSVMKSGNEYRSKKSFHLDEPFYFIIHAADAYGSGKFKRPPKYAELKIDGQSFISLDLTHFDKADYLDVGSLVDLDLSRRLKTYYVLCVNRAIPFSVFTPENPLSGVVGENVANGTHTYEISVRDERENTATVYGKFVLDISQSKKNASGQIGISDLAIAPFEDKQINLSPSLTLQFPDNCFAKNVDVEARMTSGSSFEITPDGESFRKRVEVNWKVSDAKLRLFKKLRTRWSYVDCTNDGKLLTAKIGYRTGKFALLRDDTPPVVEKIRFARKNPLYNSVAPTDFNTVFVYFKVSDRLSGVNTDDILLKVGDKNYLCEYDVDKHAAICRVDANLLRSEKKVHVVVQDNAGNERSVVSQTRF